MNQELRRRDLIYKREDCRAEVDSYRETAVTFAGGNLGRSGGVRRISYFLPSPTFMIRSFSAVLFLVFSGISSGLDRVSLIDQAEPGKGWSFNNGQEFGGGAKGGLEVDLSAAREEGPSLKLEGDFSKAGMYVQAGRHVPGTELAGVSMWVRNPGSDRFTMRLIDGSGQCHQLALVTDRSDDWQKIEFPIEEFFEKRGQSDAIPGVAKYESWGGAKDGKWHQPVTAIYLLLGKTEAQPQRTLWLNDVTLIPRPEETLVKTEVELSASGVDEWTFTNGPEFKGAKGSLENEEGGIKLSGDFTGGGAYVAALRRFGDAGLKETNAIRLKYRSGNVGLINIQLVDATGQTHQRKLPVTPDGTWNDLEITPQKIVGGEHWGGAKDGKWHHPARYVSIGVNHQSDKNKLPVISMKEVVLEGARPVVVAEAFKEDFEGGLRWRTEGGVTQEDGALRLSRSENEASRPAAATGPEFDVSPGEWKASLRYRADLISPDNSYSATVNLDVLDAAGKVLESFTVADVFGKHDWTAAEQTLELPKGSVKARFRSQLNKTWGSFWLDDVAAGFLAPSAANPNVVTRILFSTERLGNLLFPEDPRTVTLTVQAGRTLPEDHEILCVLKDYWGAEQLPPIPVRLTAGEKNTYTGTVDLSEAPLETGRYYELHATSEQRGAKPFSHQTSFAILPEAPNRKFRPEEVPFTARNWDNRVAEYIRLSDRLGIRIVGLWGGWSSKPPYKPELPRIELVKELGLGWLTTTPAKFIESGKRDYDETALREGVRNFINEFGGHRPMIINLGNEPHGTGEVVKANVAAYKALYEEIKKVDPTIPVVATSVNANREYFELGYGHYCDAYDFHIYETPARVRSTMVRKKELMKEFDVVKPVWSTELGLNSQGQTRLVVAVEVFKKTAAFFAEGGANMCWFGILYPDPEGKSHGSSGDSHNLFDCRFNRYAPRLDAIAWYHTVNAVGTKRFVEEKSYHDDIRAFLFRDGEGRSLQFLWKDKGVEDVSVPLAGAGGVVLTRVDGTVSRLDAGGGAVTLSIGEDPVLLTYEGGAGLAADLPRSAERFSSLPESVSRGGDTKLAVSRVSGIDVEMKLPPFWSVSEDLVLTAPGSTAVRELPVTVVLKKEGKVFGELYRRLPVR